MGGEGSNPSCCCHFHPKQEMVGVCALCLRERLLVLASNYPQKTLKKQTKSRIRIGKVFALLSFFHLSHPNKKFDHEAASASISSLEESFISIKFEENGQASWHSNKSLPPSSGFVGQLALYWKSEKKDRTNRTRTSSSASSCYDVKVDERLVKARKGWMKSITRKR
ncbi:uncharacterized protein LOC122034643 [Zingiber officinale]|uniref:Uncharacterized protein n=1 Tax=Zingiber officinale TaxID=94328 RepID=A0A8J5BX01_ZINOF|nr:uncharacterized protein LOC122034643 [Zingiber officinale]KAG6468636.1 hypothetical protein ZIOFF_073325 [Zingiber officinale]